MVVDAVAERTVLTQKVADLADRASDGHQLRCEPYLGLGLAPLDALDAIHEVGSQVVEAGAQVNPQLVEPVVGLVEALVRLVRLLADALEDLNGQVGRLGGVSPEVWRRRRASA